MKELGNVQNWAEMLERDFLVLQETMRLANGGSENGSGSWSGSSWSRSESESGNERMEEGGNKDEEMHSGAVDGGVLSEPQASAQKIDDDGDIAMDGAAASNAEDVKGKAKEVLREEPTTDPTNIALPASSASSFISTQLPTS